MKKLLIALVAILTIGIPNIVSAAPVVTGIKEAAEEEVKYFKRYLESDDEEAIEYYNKNYKKYVEILEKADFSKYQTSDEKVNVYVFRGSGCSFCLKALAYFSEAVNEYGEYFNVVTYEVWNSTDNGDLMQQVGETLGQSAKGVPFIVIGDTIFPGYDESFNDDIKKTIMEQYESKDRYDVMDNLGKVKKENGSSKTTSSWVVILVQVVTTLGLGTFIYFNDRNNKKEMLNKISELDKKVKELSKDKKEVKKVTKKSTAKTTKNAKK